MATRKKQNSRSPPKEGKLSRTWSLPKRSVVVVELLESAQVGVAVINVLLESGIANAADRLPVSTGKMAHGPPAVHVLAVASGHGCRKQRGEHEMLHDDDENGAGRNGHLLWHCRGSEMLYILAPMVEGTMLPCGSRLYAVEPREDAPAILAIAAQCLSSAYHNKHSGRRTGWRGSSGVHDWRINVDRWP